MTQNSDLKALVREGQQTGALLAKTLKFHFPWLGTDEEADGADTIQALADLYHCSVKAAADDGADL